MKKLKFSSLRQLILNTSFLTWIMIGFLISYLLCFIRPIFFSSQVMGFPKYIPAMDPIGIDLQQILSYSEAWLVAKQTPYIGYNLYPPLATVLFVPLLSVKFSLAYKIVTLVNVICYIFITLVFPFQMGKERQNSSLLMLVFITGLFSYGYQFELERGQFNVIAVFICFFAIWIYHYHNKYRYLAYFLFTTSVQLKIYPLIFIVMFVADWHDWKSNIKNLLMLLIFNFVLFFALGPHIFVDFIEAIKKQMVNNPYTWIGNHSIHNFVFRVSQKASDHGWTWVNQLTGLAQLILLAIIVICIFIFWLQVYRQKQNGISSHLLLACTIGALLIPSISHDYKLSILAGPVALLTSFSNTRFSEQSNTLRQHIIFIVLALIFSTVYSSTLFSYTNKPLIIENNFPALIILLFTTTFLSLISKPIEAA